MQTAKVVITGDNVGTPTKVRLIGGNKIQDVEVPNDLVVNIGDIVLVDIIDDVLHVVGRTMTVHTEGVEPQVGQNDPWLPIAVAEYEAAQKALEAARMKLDVMGYTMAIKTVQSMTWPQQEPEWEWITKAEKQKRDNE